ncbi:hypothetical protein CARUB_v10018252mg [Capsella rubella]|uniref:Uncharacterized protein n=1 Tax=Capsella rubella TaxID=81985 RepID=R0HIC3_9BRAS|nr:uncharacterized protein LOC17885020 [Capsella rubella]EOA24955.1 hypothetical protein CARUB_v10018252mg [Capsella rubella]
MFRAMSTRKIHGGYEKLGDEEAILKRVSSVPASAYGQSRNPVQEVKKTPTTVKPTGGGSAHPLFSFFDVHFQRKHKKKSTTKTKKSLATSKPEFARYMEYVKEGGVWDPSSNAPVIHYR